MTALFDFRETGLWQRTLAEQPNDKHGGQRERLRNAYLRMRSNAEKLVSLIPLDCRGLTVHDITHLDALWEMADLIAGSDFPMNPAEAFVLGAAILTHDAGMSIASYPEGIDAIIGTTEWSDIAHAALRRNGIENPSLGDLQNPPQALRPEILFGVLRALHARHAEELVTALWKIPGSTDNLRLLEDQHLRQFYGARIGRIAHSHHWDIEEIQMKFADKVGAASELPGAWTLDEIKVACLLRCADAAHIDERRAPSMLYAMMRPQGVSGLHWHFQNKLSKPTLESEALCYSSGQDFDITEAAAWWLCYDVINMINNELFRSNAVLQDLNKPRFVASRVLGAEQTSILAKHIRTKGWKPVNAEIRVSDPAYLAQTIGGINLYGVGTLAPVRELLQNSVDAIRARRKLEPLNGPSGRVVLSLEEVKKGDHSELWFHVDDNGIGMSERVLTGSLLDFGKSFWNSPMLREEFPGLESQGIDPIGKFGIGFFSVFLLGKNVKVISKKYTGGDQDIRVLEFQSISSRPVLREGNSSDLPRDFSTRISVKIDDTRRFYSLTDNFILVDARRPVGDLVNGGVPRSSQRLFASIRRLIAAVDVDIELVDKMTGARFMHSANWSSTSPEEFLRESLSEWPEGEVKEITIRAHAKNLRTLVDDDGKVYGRAALQTLSLNRYRRILGPETEAGFISVGGFSVRDRIPFYVGVLNGQTHDATRATASVSVPNDVIASWASNQATIIDKSGYQPHELIEACHRIIELGGNPSDLPFCWSNGDFITLADFKTLASVSDELLLPLRSAYAGNYELQCVPDLPSMFFTTKLRPSVIVVSTQKNLGNIFSEESVKKIAEQGRIDKIVKGDLIFPRYRGFQILLTTIERIWNDENISAEKVQLCLGDLYNQPAAELVLRITKTTP